MEIHWYSPLDPRKSEIARYSAEVVPALSTLAPVTRVSDAMSDLQPDWLSALPQESGPPSGLAALPIYHIGNNPLHYPIWRQSLETPGLVVLHDANLLDLARFASRERGRPRWWKDMLRHQYGEEAHDLLLQGEEAAEAPGVNALELPLFKPFVQRAQGVVVHSELAARLLRDALPDGPPVQQLALPAATPPEPEARDYGADQLRFVFCGHVGPNRRLLQFFEAWSRLPQPGRIALDLYGHVPNSTELMRQAAQYGVENFVALHGYVEDRALEAALAVAHFALNLRWPTMGEASASQLRYWSAGLPTLVTDVGWYGELPDAAVCKISPDNEIDAIQAFLVDVLENPGTYRDIGHNGWELLRESHSTSAYVAGLMAFAEQVLERRLAHAGLEQCLVPLIASMCRAASDIKLFHPAIQSAVATLEPSAQSRSGDANTAGSGP